MGHTRQAKGSRLGLPRWLGGLTGPAGATLRGRGQRGDDGRGRVGGEVVDAMLVGVGDGVMVVDHVGLAGVDLAVGVLAGADLAGDRDTDLVIPLGAVVAQIGDHPAQEPIPLVEEVGGHQGQRVIRGLSDGGARAVDVDEVSAVLRLGATEAGRREILDDDLRHLHFLSLSLGLLDYLIILPSVEGCK